MRIIVGTAQAHLSGQNSLPMTIYEYCARPHLVQLPDYRFCSIHCRILHRQFLEAEGYQPNGQPTYVDYALTEADYWPRLKVWYRNRF